MVDRFLEYRNRCSKPADGAYRRLLAKAWNANVGNIPDWPKRRLAVPPVKPAVEIEWEEFPSGLRRDVEKYLNGLTKVRKSHGRHIKPLRSSTIRARRAELQAAARVAVKTGVPIKKLDSLRSMLKPKVAEKILDAYWQKNGEKPELYTIDLARRFVAIARETKCLSERDCERLWEIWNCLNVQRPEEGLTEKNLAFLRKVLTPGVWGRVVKLPFAMMEEARRQRHRSNRAAVIAQLAVAIAIEAVAPVRLENLTSIKLGANLTKPDGPDFELLAALRAGGREKYRQAAIRVQGLPHPIDRRVCEGFLADAASGSQGGLSVPRVAQGRQRQSLVQRPNQWTHL